MHISPTVFILALLFLYFLAIAINVIVHELGHAIPAIILTKQKVQIFIGSFGDENKSFKVNIGLLEAWFKYNPLLWRKGLCQQTAKNIPIKQQIIYVAGGPFTSFVLAVTAALFFFQFDKNGAAKEFCILFACFSFAIFLGSIIPRDRKISGNNGNVIYNDGYLLRRLFSLKKFQTEHTQAFELYKAGKYIEAGELFEFLFKKSINYHYIFNNAANAYMLSKNYERGLQFCNSITGKYEPDSDSYCGMGTLKIYNKLYTQAEKDLKQSLKLNANNIMAMNNIGYCYNVTKQFAEAIPYLDRAIEVKPDFAYALNNRGHAKIKTGKINDGFKDIEKAMELNPAASYTQRNMGIYFMEIGGYEKALPFLRKARELDPDTDMLPELLAEVEKQISKS